MSGGSFDYVCLYVDDASELLKRRHDLRAMLDYLQQAGMTEAYDLLKPLDDAILEAEAFIADRGRHLRDLAKSVEWWVSGDWGIEAVQDAVQKLKEFKADKDTEKPTYYFNENGYELTYIQHAEFIHRNSYPDRNDAAYWIYPMLQFEDMGDYFKVTTVITHYERKKRFMVRER